MAVIKMIIIVQISGDNFEEEQKKSIWKLVVQMKNIHIRKTY